MRNVPSTVNVPVLSSGPDQSARLADLVTILERIANKLESIADQQAALASQPVADQPELMTVDEAAELLRMSTREIWRKHAQAKFGCVRDGRWARFRRSELLAYQEQQHAERPSARATKAAAARATSRRRT
jgi:excisionase family DNA binding protein